MVLDCTVSFAKVYQPNSLTTIPSGVPMVISDGRVSFPEDQVEQGNLEKFRKMEENDRKLRKCPILGHPWMKVWPCH